MRTLQKGLPILALVLIALSSCSDAPTPVSPTEAGVHPVPSFSSILSQARDVPAVAIDLPPSPRPWDTSDSALVDAVAAADGQVIIAIKQPGSQRALATGVRRGVRASDVRVGLELLRTNKVEVLELLDAMGAAIVRIDPALAPVIRALPMVDYMEPNQQIERESDTSPAVAIGAAFAESTPWGIQMVRAPQAWTITRGAGVTVQFIDTGHEQNHPDLPALPSSNCAGAFGGCDDAGLYPHGTHVIGIATAKDNTIGVVGVAPSLAGADVFLYGACSTSTGACTTNEVTAGINTAVFNAKVLSMSLSGTVFNMGMSEAVARAWLNDIVIVAAAGNSKTNVTVYPAGYSNVIGVSGVNENKSFAAQGTVPSWCTIYSNSGSHVDLSAPFSALSTLPGRTYGNNCGTSMATPHVAGAAILVRARYQSWNNQYVVNRLLTTAEDRGGVGRDNLFGHGIVDAAEAVGYVTPPPPFVVTANAPAGVTVKGTYQLTGSASDPASGWKWERSLNGGATWSLWATTPNSTFYVYGGEDYSIKWRLSARRTSDAVPDTAFANTRVCTVTGGCGPPPQLQDVSSAME